MNEEDLRVLQLAQKEVEQERIRRMEIENRFNSHADNLEGNRNQNVMEFQLDLKEELDRIYHLLRGDVLDVDEEGNTVWKEPKDDRLKILSDYGVKQLMNIIHFYINKNTLLSNYEEETIFWKVRDFGIELSDLLFNRYEAFFYYPTPEELYEKLYNYSKQMGIPEDELYTKCIQWSKEELQSKLRHYPIIVMALVDSIHSTYLRALNGEERESLRKQMSIIQSLNNNEATPSQQSKFSLNPLKWAR